jgi:hypothetical protein
VRALPECRWETKHSKEEDGVIDDARLQAAQEELMRHHWDTFCTEPLSIAQGGKAVIVPGCVHCKKLLYTGNQYLSHLAIDVLPGILEKACS